MVKHGLVLVGMVSVFALAACGGPVEAGAAGSTTNALKGEQGGKGTVTTAPVGADGVYPGNLICPDGYESIKVDPPKEGTYGDGDVTVTVSDLTDTSFQWSADGGVDIVIVKAGPVSNVVSGDKLSGGTAESAINPDNGEGYEISHIVFCSPKPAGTEQDPVDKDPLPEDTTDRPGRGGKT